MKRTTLLGAFLSLILMLVPGQAQAGPIFLTGHDPDFHSQDSAGAKNLLRAGLSYVTNGTYNVLGHKFLWVESRPNTAPSGYRFGEAGLTSLGLTLGVNYDRANGAELASVNLSNYSAIVVASGFGGLLTSAELDELIARKTDIKNFVNAGGGVFAMSEGTQSGFLGANPNYFGFLPVTISSVADSPPFNVTAAGAAAPFNLNNGDVNDPTHNSFGLIAGLTPLDRDQSNHATTLAGNVNIGDTGFTPTGAVPEPSTFALFGMMLALGAGCYFMQRRKVVVPASVA